jgi:PAS domain S-box-containing protein
VGRILGRQGARLLNGEDAKSIPVQTGEFQRYTFDWRQLHRWGISDEDIPAGSSVLYWQSSPWDVYGRRILGLVAAVVIETLLVLVLLRSRATRKRAEETLSRKESELSEAQRLAQLGSWKWDSKTEMVTCSEEFIRIVGFDEQLPTFPFQHLAQFFAAESWQRLTRGMEKILGGESYEAELEGLRMSGRKTWVAFRGEGVRDTTGSVLQVHGTIQDITERITAEEARLKHAAIVESLDDAIISQDLDGIIRSWNLGAQRMFGFTEAEAVGRPITIIVPPECQDEERTILQRLNAGERIEHYETARVSKEGKKVFVSLTMAPVRDSSGRVVGFSKIARDITSRKQADLLLLETEKRFRLMADLAPVLMWMSGPDKLFTDFNRGWLGFTGRTLQEELGEGWTRNVHPDDLQSCLQTYRQAFDARESFATEYRFRRHDSQYRWMLDQGVPRYLDDGVFAGYIGCCIDITDEKEAKTILAELSGRLIRAQEEERARIARELHDDVNQRLALLANGLYELLTAERGETTLKKELSELLEGATQIATDIHHLSHGLHPSKLQYLGLAAAVRELCEEFSKQHKIRVECIVRGLPAKLDENARVTLFRTIQESLRNVAKHSQARHVKIELTGESEAVRLCISDDGVGFSFRRDGNRGLGLVSMRERVKLIGGEFSIRPLPLGTQVEVTIPADRTAGPLLRSAPGA